MFIIGGIFKLFGDIVVLVGPLSISHIVEYIENLNKTDLIELQTINNLTTNNNNSYIFYPNWTLYLSNGWIISIFVLITSLAQGTLSQASTHIVNMVGIRLKTAIQCLVYRKTLLISSSCFYNKNSIEIERKKDQQLNGTTSTTTTTTTTMENDNQSAADAGTITNLMSEDSFNVMSFFWIAHYVWALPLKVSWHSILFIIMMIQSFNVL